MSQWYDLTTSSSTKKPYTPRITTVKPWTSLDIAKPSWEDSDQASPGGEQPEHNHHDKNPPSMTYGAWNKDNLKLEAVPFSRATDGKERKWVRLNSTVKKRKIIIPSNARHLEINENVGFQVVPAVVTSKKGGGTPYD